MQLLNNGIKQTSSNNILNPDKKSLLPNAKEGNITFEVKLKDDNIAYCEIGKNSILSYKYGVRGIVGGVKIKCNKQDIFGDKKIISRIERKLKFILEKLFDIEEVTIEFDPEDIYFNLDAKTLRKIHKVAKDIPMAIVTDVEDKFWKAG